MVNLVEIPPNAYLANQWDDDLIRGKHPPHPFLVIHSLAEEPLSDQTLQIDPSFYLWTSHGETYDNTGDTSRSYQLYFPVSCYI